MRSCCLGLRPSHLVHQRVAGSLEEAADVVDLAVDRRDAGRRVARPVDLAQEAADVALRLLRVGSVPHCSGSRSCSRDGRVRHHGRRGDPGLGDDERGGRRETTHTGTTIRRTEE